jgi:hypothetical protein
MPSTRLEEWHFDFGLCAQDGNSIAHSECDELLDLIIDWAEQHGYGIGGGFRPFGESDE